LLATAGVVAAALVTATAVSTWQAVRAREAQAHAEVAERRAADEAAIAQAVNDFLQADLLGQVGSLPKSNDEFGGNPNLTVREALDRAAAKIGDRFRDQPLVDAAIRMAIGEAYMSLNEWQLAESHLERAAALRQTQLGPDHPDTVSSMRDLAAVYT